MSIVGVDCSWVVSIGAGLQAPASAVCTPLHLGSSSGSRTESDLRDESISTVSWGCCSQGPPTVQLKQLDLLFLSLEARSLRSKGGQGCGPSESSGGRSFLVPSSVQRRPAVLGLQWFVSISSSLPPSSRGFLLGTYVHFF
ncbi:unnamed protein product [Rangifer tarandus platyrhynchus]|uniref:Uncharacterized protein n=2 Tax=Rangifer tarandus platyrhynchus TaxID=3082113 RepID=A0ABN8ZRB0_RANTA|nr:unnamed protein product [Rangifer tarandus platyrhynchus]